ncbi:MAG: site-specific integrase [Marinisporobacter sp.]|jgi:integrase|nr:site-specific integrase [Marinisporobacter sp.]
MASIQKKGNKYYIVTKVNGKQKWIPGKKNKEETKKYMQDLLYKLDKDIVRKDTVTIKVKEYLDNWFNTYCINNLKLTTYTGYRYHIDNYINPRIGDMKLIDLKPIQIQNLYYDLLKNGRVNGKKPLNSKTVIQTHRVLHKAFKNAVMLQMMESNPCDYVELPRKKIYRCDVLQENEIQGFIRAFEDTEIYLAVIIAITLGLRRGELLALLWSDIDFNKKTITINKTIVVGDREIKVDTTKTEKSNRVLLIPTSLLSMLELERKKRNADLNDYIILNLKGQRFNPSSFSRRYTDLRRILKLKEIRFHDLRHTNATMMYRSGIKTKVMQERLGHSNIATTLDIYTHLFKEDQEDVASLFDRKIFGN